MSRSEIFARIRAANTSTGSPAPLPEYDPAIARSRYHLAGGDDLAARFAANLAAVNGRPMGSVHDVAAFLSGLGIRRGYCDPSLYQMVGGELAAAGFEVETTYDRARYDDYQFGVTLATGAIAESGTLILDDRFTSSRLAALTPWVHVAVLDRGTIHPDIAAALAALGDSPNVTWVTGPSKTADVEGILIEGVHGPGEQIALML